MYDFLNDCYYIEELATKTYQLLAANRTFDPDLRQLFQRLSNDERRHAQHIDLVRQSSKNELDGQARISMEKLKHAKILAEQLFYMVDRGGINEEKALQMAVRMEQEFINVHVNNSMHFHNNTVAILFDQLWTDDQDHIDALNTGLKLWRRKKREQKSI